MLNRCINPRGMLSPPVCEKWLETILSLCRVRNTQLRAEKSFSSRSFHVCRWLPQGKGQLSLWHSRNFPGFGSSPARPSHKELLIGDYCFIFFMFFFSPNQHFLIAIMKELRNKGFGSRAAASLLFPGYRLIEREGRGALISAHIPCPPGSRSSQRFAA